MESYMKRRTSTAPNNALWIDFKRMSSLSRPTLHGAEPSTKRPNVSPLGPCGRWVSCAGAAEQQRRRCHRRSAAPRPR